MSDQFISREALKNEFKARLVLCNEWIEKAKDKETKIRASAVKTFIVEVLMTIDNAPTVEPFEKIGSICEENCGYNPQGKYVDISKLRLMTVEECAGHTIDYAMGWKACIEWIKKDGAE